MSRISLDLAHYDRGYPTLRGALQILAVASIAKDADALFLAVNNLLLRNWMVVFGYLWGLSGYLGVANDPPIANNAL